MDNLGFKDYIDEQEEEFDFTDKELDKLSSFFLQVLKIKMPDSINQNLPYHWFETSLRKKYGFSIGIINRQTLDKNREIGIKKKDFKVFEYFIKVSGQEETKNFDFLDQALLEIRRPAIKIIEINKRSREDFKLRKKLMNAK